MTSEIKNYATGTIIPLGDGFTGKSVLSRLIINPHITSIEHGDILFKTKKSYNIEIEFMTEKILVGDRIITSTPQLYIFPGQRQKENPHATTFDEILDVFDCFPALIKVSVLLLVYDVTNDRTLQSLDTWLRFAYVKDWIFEDTLIVLVPNKVDLQRPDDKTIDQALKHIKEFAKEHELPIEGDQIITIETSCVSLEGIHNLRDTIMHWVAFNGIQGVGIKEIEEATKEVLS